MIGFLMILVLAVGVIGGASWFYKNRIAGSDSASSGALVLLVMVLALLIVVMVGAAKLAGGNA